MEHRADVVKHKGSEMSTNPLKFDTHVLPGGKIEISVPLPPGDRVEVVVIPQDAEELQDLMKAATSSMDFWDNPTDDAEWNDA